VKLICGDEPPYGSGRSTTASPNSVWSEMMQPGDKIWTVDDSGNGVASATISAGTSDIPIDRGGFR
jgi:hypothetical protein